MNNTMLYGPYASASDACVYARFDPHVQAMGEFWVAKHCQRGMKPWYEYHLINPLILEPMLGNEGESLVMLHYRFMDGVWVVDWQC